MILEEGTGHIQTVYHFHTEGKGSRDFREKYDKDSKLCNEILKKEHVRFVKDSINGPYFIYSKKFSDKKSVLEKFEARKEVIKAMDKVRDVINLIED